MWTSWDHHGRFASRNAAMAYGALLVLAGILFSANASGNPPGFYIDESSIAYNAHLIATTSQDEHGISNPLFFRAFGDYKNPSYIYLLATIFRVTGPSIRVARLFSATLGVFTVLALALLAARLSKNWRVGFAIGLTALLTPWLFELGRIVLAACLREDLVVHYRHAWPGLYAGAFNLHLLDRQIAWSAVGIWPSSVCYKIALALGCADLGVLCITAATCACLLFAPSWRAHRALHVN